MKQFLKKLSYAAITFNTALLLTTPTYSEPPNLSIVKNEIKKYHDSGQYQHDLALVVKKAQHYVAQQAKINAHQNHPKKLAIVLDIDETSLSNYKHMIQRDFTGTHKDFHHDVMAADAPAIKPTLALYQDAVRHGVSVFFVTGRHQSERQATQMNLHRAGYKHWTGLYLRPNNYTRKSIIPFKSHTRELITQKGYTIVATIGDQCSDIKGGYAEKGFKLPNPYYYLP
ncbi:MAG: HAD family acid phosphatase [Legionella sp.]|uniref:HAD family acid phosphatase n=1 Tax=Legionella sp. TaxID=459 RepID=UPI0039E3B5AB